MTTEEKARAEYDYRKDYYIRTDRAIIALPGWRAIYDFGDAEPDVCEGVGYFLAVIRLKVFRRLREAPENIGWELEKQRDPADGERWVYETEYWGFVELPTDMSCLWPVEETANFIRMLPPGQEISKEDRAEHQRRSGNVR